MNETITYALLTLEQKMLENDLSIWENLLDKCSQIQNIRIAIIALGIAYFYLLIVWYLDHRKLIKLTNAGDDE